MNLSSKFPRYEKYDPSVPVFCITHELGRCIHRFFDTSPISPSGRYMAVFQLPFEDRRPEPGDRGNVIVIDLESGRHKLVAETCGWEAQMGANINWGGSDHELFFNDVDTDSWQPFAWKVDPIADTRQKMQGCVYHASPDGKWLISANMTSMRRTQAGYGVILPHNRVQRNIGAATDDGFYLTDTSTGKQRLFLSIADILARANPPVKIDAPEQFEIYGFHCKFNPQGDQLMLSLRWYETSEEPAENMIRSRDRQLHFAWVTVPLDGSEIRCAVGPEQWIKGGHHATWFPDGKRISMNLNIDRDILRFVQVNDDGTGLRKVLDNVVGSGHPTIHPNGKHLLTDTYVWEKCAYQDGTIPLRWVDLENGSEQNIVRIRTQSPHQEELSDLRIDPHPAWDRTWRYITFNAFEGGTRNVYVADMSGLLS